MLAAATQLLPVDPAVDYAVARLDAWLETMRSARGYGGPVAHWRQQSLVYTGPGRDWRYEGIIAGYLDLWRSSGDAIWLSKARRAGDDLLGGQLADGHFAASAFEANPSSAGSPHESACDVGLLLLASVLRQAGEPAWERYAGCAEHNLRGHYITRLWERDSVGPRAHPRLTAFVSHKAATVCESLFLLADLRDEALWVEHYALPTLDAILSHQVTDEGPLEGAIAQNSFGGRPVEQYFPLFIARCIPALLQGYDRTGAERYFDAARRAMGFIERWVGDDGAPPMLIRGDEEPTPAPLMVAPLGDLLRVADLLCARGVDVDLGAMRRRLLDGQDASGGIQLATGFAATTDGGDRPKVPDLRDLLHVVGWCDKAFRYLAAHASPTLPQVRSELVTAECTFHGRHLSLTESEEILELRHHGRVRYCWHKGRAWADVAEREFWMR